MSLPCHTNNALLISWHTFWDINYSLRLSVQSRQTEKLQTTDKRWCIWAHRASCTGGLKNYISGDNSVIQTSTWTLGGRHTKLVLVVDMAGLPLELHEWRPGAQKRWWNWKSTSKKFSNHCSGNKSIRSTTVHFLLINMWWMIERHRKLNKWKKIPIKSSGWPAKLFKYKIHCNVHVHISLPFELKFCLVSGCFIILS